MAKIVNLRSARKAKERAEKRALGDRNAARSGRSKAQKQLDEKRAQKADRHLDGHKLSDE